MKAKAKVQGLDYWRRNCFNCAYFRRLHILYDGKDDGSVRFQCTQTDEDIMPHKIDGCKKFEQGTPKEENKNVGTEHKTDVAQAKSGVSSEKSGV